MKKIFRHTVSLTLFTLAVFSINSGLTQEKKTSTSPTKLVDLLPKQCVFSGAFTQQKTINTLPKPLSSEGIMFFSCKHGLIWKNIKPFPESLIYTSENVHFRNTESEQAIPLEGQQHYYLAKFLIDLLSANIESLNEQFSIESGSSENGLILLPNNAFIKKGLQSISIAKEQEDKSKKESLVINIKDPKGQTTLLEINNLIVHSKTKKANIEGDCISATKNDKHEENACNILSDPQRYQTIEPIN